MASVADAGVRARYESRLYLRAGVWAALALGALVPWAFWLPPGDPGNRELALAVMEMFTVIGAPLLAGSVLSRDHEDGSAEILLSRPAGRVGLLAWRLLPALAALGVLIALSVAGYAARGIVLAPGAVLAAVGPGALFLAALAVAVGTVTRLSAAAYLAPVAYWVFDWASKGSYTGYLTLFGRGLGAADWTTGKLALLAAAAVLIGVAGAGAARRG